MLFFFNVKGANVTRSKTKKYSRSLYSSCFKIPEAAVNLQRKALGKHNNVERLFKGEAYCPAGYGIVFFMWSL
ncbi:MAG: hypothetical protein LBJ00_12385 [Planctomycetaceae bacterium]|jgi:hypothetical protein|nr:hypothetical protein [Planctomycetaceae bacterium]